MSFRLTYATMFDPPAALHTAFEAALAALLPTLAARHALYIDGRDVDTGRAQRHVSPIDHDIVLGDFALGSAAEVERAVAAARLAAPGWRATPVAERIALLRRVADVLEARVYALAAALVLEVGKNRMEALAEAQETVDFFRLYAEGFERAQGFDVALPNDPIEGVVATNRSTMRPYGVWAVIAPFNYPLALLGGPTAAALVTGNVVVAKGSPHTPWAGRLLAEALRDAGLPAGVFHLVHGGNDDVGRALMEHDGIDGYTFTGSVAVGRRLLARCASGRWPRPCIAEMGGKNPCIVTEHADLDAAAAGIVRSAYGMSGQKCSSLSRLYVHEAVADALVARLRERIAAVRIGDPTQREVWIGPLINAAAQARWRGACERLRADGALLHVEVAPAREGLFARGAYAGPVLAEAPPQHPLWREELFAPLLLLHRVRSRDEAMALANDSDVGLTAGFYGAADEVAWFHDRIEAGVTYANRAQGATTGAWPGYQPFGGWKGSSSTGKAIASFHALPLYMREQSRTVVVR